MPPLTRSRKRELGSNIGTEESLVPLRAKRRRRKSSMKHLLPRSPSSVRESSYHRLSAVERKRGKSILQRRKSHQSPIKRVLRSHTAKMIAAVNEVNTKTTTTTTLDKPMLKLMPVVEIITRVPAQVAATVQQTPKKKRKNVEDSKPRKLRRLSKPNLEESPPIPKLHAPRKGKKANNAAHVTTRGSRLKSISNLADEKDDRVPLKPLFLDNTADTNQVKSPSSSSSGMFNDEKTIFNPGNIAVKTPDDKKTRFTSSLSTVPDTLLDTTTITPAVAATPQNNQKIEQPGVTISPPFTFSQLKTPKISLSNGMDAVSISPGTPEDLIAQEKSRQSGNLMKGILELQKKLEMRRKSRGDFVPKNEGDITKVKESDTIKSRGSVSIASPWLVRNETPSKPTLEPPPVNVKSPIFGSDLSRATANSVEMVRREPVYASPLNANQELITMNNLMGKQITPIVLRKSEAGTPTSFFKNSRRDDSLFSQPKPVSFVDLLFPATKSSFGDLKDDVLIDKPPPPPPALGKPPPLPVPIPTLLKKTIAPESQFTTISKKDKPAEVEIENEEKSGNSKQKSSLKPKFEVKSLALAAAAAKKEEARRVQREQRKRMLDERRKLASQQRLREEEENLKKKVNEVAPPTSKKTIPISMKKPLFIHSSSNTTTNSIPPPPAAAITKKPAINSKKNTLPYVVTDDEDDSGGNTLVKKTIVNGNTVVDIPDVDSDCLMSDEEGAGGGGGGEKLVPEWTKRAHEYLQRQRYVDPDLIFGNTKTTIVISEVFGVDKKRYKLRGSSAKWEGSDKLREDEKKRYRQKMNYL